MKESSEKMKEKEHPNIFLNEVKIYYIFLNIS